MANATQLPPNEWCCVRIITVSREVGERLFTADIVYERAINDQYPVATTDDASSLLKKCTCPKDNLDQFLLAVIANAYKIEHEMEEIVMFDIDRYDINKYLSCYQQQAFLMQLTPVLDARFAVEPDVFQFELPMYVHCLENDTYAKNLFSKVGKVPYLHQEYAKVNNLVLELQNKIMIERLQSRTQSIVNGY